MCTQMQERVLKNIKAQIRFVPIHTSTLQKHEKEKENMFFKTLIVNVFFPSMEYTSQGNPLVTSPHFDDDTWVNQPVENLAT